MVDKFLTLSIFPENVKSVGEAGLQLLRKSSHESCTIDKVLVEAEAVFHTSNNKLSFHFSSVYRKS
jgi:hypothetical protein